MEKTNDNFWDCECEKRYIHSKVCTHCSLCGTNEEDAPDAHTVEVPNVALHAPCVLAGKPCDLVWGTAMTKEEEERLFDDFVLGEIRPPDLIRLFSHLFRTRNPRVYTIHDYVGKTAAYLVAQGFMNSDGTLFAPALQVLDGTGEIGYD